MREIKTLIAIIECVDPDNKDDLTYRIFEIEPCKISNEDFPWPGGYQIGLPYSISGKSLSDLCKNFFEWYQTMDKEYLYVINWNIKLDRSSVLDDISEPLCRVRTFWPEEVEKFHYCIYKIANGNYSFLSS